MADPRALLYVMMDPPTDEDAFRAWYDQHASVRLRMPGISSAARYETVEGDGPRYMACYDLEDVSTLQSPEYLKLRETEAVTDREMRASIPLIDRRLYRALDPDKPWTAPWTDHAPYLLSVAMEPAPDSVDEYHAWYLEEHIPMLMEVPGWRRARRFEQVEGTGLRFLALHELESPDVFEHEAYKASISTPWRLRMRDAITRRQRLVFKLLRGYPPPPRD
jgi:hypothetical protein